MCTYQIEDDYELATNFYLLRNPKSNIPTLMKTIIVLNYAYAEVDIIHNVPEQNDYDVYVSTTLNYDLDNITYMVVDGDKKLVPNHFNPEDFQQ